MFELAQLKKSNFLTKRPWSFLQQLLLDGSLEYVDYALAEELLSGYEEAREEAAALICYLAVAARAGHLCIKCQNSQLLPDPSQLFRGCKHTQKLAEMALNGMQYLPADLISHESILNTPLYVAKDCIYLQKYWNYEKELTEHLRKLLSATPWPILQQDRVKSFLEGLQRQKKLLPLQAQAIEQASQQSLTLICGGPGTGKTYTAGQCIRVFWELISSEERNLCKLALAAPTGKAAANLQHSFNKAIGDVKWCSVQAQTIHSLLELRNAASWRSVATLPYDIILVDESSMIDARLMAALLSAIKPSARLLLLGDPAQLPPVSAGATFSDMVTCLPKQVCELTTCMRTEKSTLLALADAVREGRKEEVFLLLSSQTDIQTRFFTECPPYSMQKAVVEHVLPMFRNTNQGVDALFNSLGEFRLLSPMRQGPFGVDALNEMIAKKLANETKLGKLFIAPILIVQNDHQQNLYNGEIGLLVKQEGVGPFKKGDYALFPAKNLTGVGVAPYRKIAAILLPRYEYAYCLSVHKSQGSEFNHVLLLMPEGAELFGREVVYTAVTRARKHLEIWGYKHVLEAAIAKKEMRLSGIKCCY